MKRLIGLLVLLVSSVATAQLSRPMQIQNAGVTSTPNRYTLNFVNGGCVDNALTLAKDCTFNVPASAFPLLAPNGLVTAPSYSFTNDTNSGLFLGTPDSVMQLAFNGEQRIRIDTNGVYNYSATGNAVLAVVSTSKAVIAAGTRLFISAATPADAAAFALSGGWGTTASVGTITGDDNHMRFIVTSAGTGQAANPTIAYTFKDGTWGGIAPFCQVHFEDASTAADLNTNVITQSASATVLTMTYRATAPTAGRTYTFSVSCVGV